MTKAIDFLLLPALRLWIDVHRAKTAQITDVRHHSKEKCAIPKMGRHIFYKYLSGNGTYGVFAYTITAQQLADLFRIKKDFAYRKVLIW